MVCIHTAGACSLEFYLFLPVMARNGFRAIAIDLPGHGKSYPKDWQPFRVMREYAAFTWKVIKAICPNEKMVVTGSSIGGDMVTDMACHYSKDILAVLSLEGEYHAFLDFDRVIERPDARDHRLIVLRKAEAVAPQVRGGLVLFGVAPRFFG